MQLCEVGSSKSVLTLCMILQNWWYFSCLAIYKWTIIWLYHDDVCVEIALPPWQQAKLRWEGYIKQHKIWMGSVNKIFLFSLFHSFYMLWATICPYSIVGNMNDYSILTTLGVFNVHVAIITCFMLADHQPFLTIWINSGYLSADIIW